MLRSRYLDKFIRTSIVTFTISIYAHSLYYDEPIRCLLLQMNDYT